MAQSLIHVISPDDDRSVVSLTSIHGLLFVLRSPSEQRIQVYDVNSFGLQGFDVPVKGLSDAATRSALTSCVANNCLYVSDWDKDAVHKVDLTMGNKVSAWQVASGPTGLSVNAACNLLVTCSAVDTLQEYTSNGSLIREIRLQSNVANLFPYHALQMTSGQFVVSCWNDKNKFINSTFVGNRGDKEDFCDNAAYDVVEADAQGRLITSCCNKLQLADNRMYFRSPTQLASDRNNDCILVVDSGNNRIVVLNRNLNCASELNLTGNDGLDVPSCLHFDETCGRLYVGENSGRRILMYSNVLNIAAAVNKPR
jgi:hypothetical protein